MRGLRSLPWESLESFQQGQYLGPRDKFTRLANPLHSLVGGLLSLPLLILVPVSTFLLGLMVRVTFGLLLIPMSAVWWVFLLPVVGSSWVWVKVPLVRPVLLVPGVLAAQLAAAFASLMPEMGEMDSRLAKQALCNAWPVTFLMPPFTRINTGADNKAM
mgnify:CR=1 FL=1